jgi:hypothetical protein
MCESEVVCLNGNCKFNDALMDGNCAKGEEPQLYDCREAIIARRGVHGLLVSVAQNTVVCPECGNTVSIRDLEALCQCPHCKVDYPFVITGSPKCLCSPCGKPNSDGRVEWYVNADCPQHGFMRL